MRLWTGVGISAVLLALFLLTVDVGHMVGAIVSANYWYVVPAIALYFVSILFRAVRWAELLAHIKPIGIVKLYPIVVIGYMANNILPMRLGELVRSHYLGHGEGISRASVLMTVFVERIMDALTLLFFVAVVSIFVPLDGLAEGLSKILGLPSSMLMVAMSMPFVAAFVSLLVLSGHPERVERVVSALTKPLPEGIRINVMGISKMSLDALRPLSKLKSVLKLFVLSIPIWLLESGLFILVGLSFGLQDLYDSFWLMAACMVLVTAIANIGSSVPAAPGGLGLFELVARETLILLPVSGIDRALAGAYVLVVHAALLLPMIGLGQIFLLKQHLSLGSIWRVSTRNTMDSGQGLEVTPTGVGDERV